MCSHRVRIDFQNDIIIRIFQYRFIIVLAFVGQHTRVVPRSNIDIFFFFSKFFRLLPHARAFALKRPFDFVVRRYRMEKKKKIILISAGNRRPAASPLPNDPYESNGRRARERMPHTTTTAAIKKNYVYFFILSFFLFFLSFFFFYYSLPPPVPI